MKILSIIRVNPKTIDVPNDSLKIQRVYNMYHVPQPERVRLVQQFLKSGTNTTYIKWLVKTLDKQNIWCIMKISSKYRQNREVKIWTKQV